MKRFQSSSICLTSHWRTIITIFEFSNRDNTIYKSPLTLCFQIFTFIHCKQCKRYSFNLLQRKQKGGNELHAVDRVFMNLSTNSNDNFWINSKCFCFTKLWYRRSWYVLKDSRCTVGSDKNLVASTFKPLQAFGCVQWPSAYRTQRITMGTLQRQQRSNGANISIRSNTIHRIRILQESKPTLKCNAITGFVTHLIDSNAFCIDSTVFRDRDTDK